MLAPDDFLTIDESLYPTRNQVNFKQYNPMKPAKYGLLFKSLNGARYPYTFTSSVYAGKPKGDPSPYYISGIDNHVQYLVNNAMKHSNLAGRNISFDRLYTSIPLDNWLLERIITTIGTLKSNRKGLPADMKSLQNRDEMSYQVC